MKLFHPSITAALLLLLPSAPAWAQLGGSPRVFYDIPLGTYPGIMKQERGVAPGIASGTHAGFYIRFAEDISNLCAKYEDGPNSPQFRLNCFATQGAFDSLKRLRTEDEVQLAIVQSDLSLYAKLFGSPLPVGSTKPRSEEQRIQASWKEIGENIRTIMPLYEEKIHILVRPSDKGVNFRELADLFEKQADVNIGTLGSGGYVTCTLLKQLWSSRLGPNDGNTWREEYEDSGTALERLIDPSSGLDAVILIGGVPFPALEKFSVEVIKKKTKSSLVTDLFTGNQIVPQLALLEFGDKMGKVIDDSKMFRGYLPATIRTDDYSFLQLEKDPIKTRATIACLVTHAKYNDKATNESHKIKWVRHIVYRTLSRLRSNSTYGLVDDFGVPLAGSKWLDTARLLQAVNGNEGLLNWEYSFGFPQHDDVILKEMLRSWGSGLPGGTSTKVIDPDKQF